MDDDLENLAESDLPADLPPQPVRRRHGFSSLAGLVDSLDAELVVKSGKVYHNMYAGNKLSKAERKKVIKNILDLIEEHPRGVRLATLGTVYKQKYNKKMGLSQLGFETIEDLQEKSPDTPEPSEEEVARPATSSTPASSSTPVASLPTNMLSFLGPPLFQPPPMYSTPALALPGSMPRQEEKLTNSSSNASWR
ncbi:hypothetical protein WMY93_009903 [Mugilogobius chulae]|uniref:HTH OST-type domain-containing protein n=1 Tax=Mugilogobius chulae TaxID=88201 RepID=A0AAW0PEP7_9GOBI